MSFISDLKNKIIESGYEVSRDEAIRLLSEDLGELCAAANEIREKFHGNNFDFCSIVNARSGRCSENCKYCAQSSYYHTGAPEYKLLPRRGTDFRSHPQAQKGDETFRLPFGRTSEPGTVRQT